MTKYAQVSRRIMEVLAEFTPLMEAISIDEAFLDVSASRALMGDGPTIAARIKARIREAVGLAASVGVASNKFVAKVASDLEKPDGLVVVAPGAEAAFLGPLPIARLWGVGKVTAAELESIGVRTIGQLAVIPEAHLQARFGASGAGSGGSPSDVMTGLSSRSRRPSPWEPRRPSSAITGTSSGSAPRCAGRRSGWRGSCARRDTRGGPSSSSSASPTSRP
jgi:hypothetical protein